MVLWYKKILCVNRKLDDVMMRNGTFGKVQKAR